MNTVLDVELDCHFTESLDAAALAASIQAANTGAAVLSVDAIELGNRRATFFGTMPDRAVTPRSVGEATMPRIRSLYTTWDSVLHPSGTIGFMVLSQPVVCDSHEAEDPALCRVAISVPRVFATVPPSILGPVCCSRCWRPISIERMKAIPGMRTCVTCQKQSEEYQQ
jgi:hypothetical protein